MATPAKKRTAAAASKAAAANRKEKKRLWLMYPPQKITRPILWELGKKFELITNIRQASVTDQIGILCVELDGKSGEIARAISWLVKSGVNVEPVEIGVLES